MSLAAGTRLGPYEVLAPLGAGGMGEVYRARDSRLGRDVALKVIPLEFAHDPERVRRFEQEARAAGALAHSNVVAIHDVGVHDGTPFVVMELLEGDTLRERLRAGPLPVRKAIDYTSQVAYGLAAAHQKGIVHRDLKPENLWVTHDGRVKILDFGLAKLTRPEVTSTSDTVSFVVTESGALLGTPGYMAPEQVRRELADHRSDLFALGAILYELLTGKQAFHGPSLVETSYAILNSEPAPLSASGRDIPPGLETLVRRCLEKEPSHRFESAHDLALALEVAAAALGSVAPVEPTPDRRRRLALVGLGLALVVGTGLLTYFWTQQAAPPRSPVHQLRPLTSLTGLEESPAISPDGKMVAFTVLQGRRRQIFIRYLADSPTRPVTTDEADHEAPRWLPNGSALVYFSPAGPGEAQGTIYRIPALGGHPQRVTASLGGGDVSRDGRLACFRLDNDRIQLVTMSLDDPVVTPIAELPTRHYDYPRWSPDGQRIAFQQGDGFRSEVCVVGSVAGSKPIEITHESRVIRGLAWLPDGSGVVYATSRASTIPYLPPLSLWEARLDGRQRQLTSADASYEQPDVHESGRVSVSRLRMRHDIWAYPFDSVSTLGNGRQVTGQTGQVLTPTVSPDGREVAYLSDDGGHGNVWIESAADPARQITFESDPDVTIGVPSWSPGGRWIAYVSSKGNPGLVFGIWLINPDGSENHQLVPNGISPTWSEDGQWVYYVKTPNTPILRIPASGGSPELVRSEPARNIIGVDGSTVYYVVDRAKTDGRKQFEFRAAPHGDGPARTILTVPVSRVPPWQVANPALSPDCRWLAMPLTDGFTTNVWAISTEDARMRRVTDFGDRGTFIARRVSWSHDGRSIVAAVGEGDADIVMLDGLIPGVRR